MKDAARNNAGLERWQERIAFALLVIQPLIFFRSVLLSRTRHIPFDLEEFHLPLASFIARSARDHIWPYWDPFTYCGTSLWADIQAQLFYPLTWPALLLGNLSDGRRLYFWLETLIPLHMIIGGVFAYLFVRRLRCSVPIALFAATTYQLGGFFASQAQHLGAVCAAAWFPLLLLCVVDLAEGFTARAIGITSIAVALTILSGFPAATNVVFASVILFAVLLVLSRASNAYSIAALFAAMAVGVCVSAIQLIPTAEAYGVSIATLRADWHILGGGLAPQSLVSFVWPNYYRVFTPLDPNLYKLPFNFTQMYIYCGHLALLLLLSAPVLIFLRRRERGSRMLFAALVLVLLNLFWMLGEATSLYSAIFTRIPRMLRGSIYAEYALLPFTLWVAVAAALSLRELRLKHADVFCWLAALAASVNLIAVSSNRPMNATRGRPSREYSDYIVNGYAEPVQQLQKLSQAANPPLRIDFFSPVYWPFNSGADLYRVPSAIGDNPLMNLRYYYFRLSFSGANYWERIQYLTGAASPWIDAIDDGLVLVFQDGRQPSLPAKHFDRTDFFGFDLWHNKNPLPRFYLVDRVRRARNMDQARSFLPTIRNPSEEAIVENLDPNWIGSGRQGSSVETVSYSNNRIELFVHTAGPSYLVTSEAYYPGWSATLNGRSVGLLPTNLAFRGLPVPAGDSRIIMTFRPNHLSISIVLSLLGLAACATMIARRPKSTSRPVQNRDDRVSIQLPEASRFRFGGLYPTPPRNANRHAV